MSKEKIIELIICSLTTNVFATDADELLGDDDKNENVKNIPEKNNSVNKNTNSNSNRNSNTNSNSNSNSNNGNKNAGTAMPATGVDYSVLTIIGVCGISAVYAYKKISDYRNV